MESRAISYYHASLEIPLAISIQFWEFHCLQEVTYLYNTLQISVSFSVTLFTHPVLSLLLQSLASNSAHLFSRQKANRGQAFEQTTVQASCINHVRGHIDLNVIHQGSFMISMKEIYHGILINLQDHIRRRQIKMQFSDLHFKHPHILHTSDELLSSNFFLQSIIPKTSEMEKLVRP